MSAADAVVAGAAAAGLCGASGRPAERRSVKPEGHADAAKRHLDEHDGGDACRTLNCARTAVHGKSREATFYFLMLSCWTEFEVFEGGLTLLRLGLGGGGGALKRTKRHSTKDPSRQRPVDRAPHTTHLT